LFLALTFLKREENEKEREGGLVKGENLCKTLTNSPGL
jgi:hypothetical protein